jgi:hypothetical protein
MAESINREDFLEQLLNQESSFLENLTPINGQVGTTNPMSPHRSNFETDPLSATLADQVLQCNLLKIEELTRNEKTLNERINELENTLEKFHLESETKYSNLKKKFESTLEDLTSLKESKI